MLSAPIRCTQGIIAGCPFAPGLSKLMIHPIIQPMWNKKGIRHIDVWLDDIGIDVEARNPLQAAKRGQEVFREVKTRLQGEGLTLSIKKTVFVVTDGKTRKAMNTIREKDEPEVRFQAKDLGVDTSGGGHKSYRIGKEELPSLTSALNWRRVLIGMGQSCPSRGQECRSPVKPSGKVLSGQARMPGVPGVKNPARTST